MDYKNILLIDDDTDDQEIFLSALSKISDSIVCTACSDASLALSKLLGKEIKPDIIFLDLNMPVMTGQQFLVEIKKHQNIKEIPVIVFSTTSHFPTIQLVKSLGALDFITKPGKFTDYITILTPILKEKKKFKYP